MGKEPVSRFKVLPLSAVKPRGWMLAQLNRDLQEGFASRLDDLTDHASNDLFKNRIDTSNDHYAWWDSETRGNWLWGYTMMAYLSTDETHQRHVDDLVADLKSTQDSDGYIGIYSPQDRFHHAVGENGELWGQSRALQTLLTYYELTGDESYLMATEAAVALTMQRYGPDGERYFRTGDTRMDVFLGGLFHGLCYVDTMEWLYNLSGKQSYRDFGVWLYRDFSAIPGVGLNQDMKLSNLLEYSLPFRGHAAHTAEHFRILLWSYFMTGDDELKKAVTTAIEKLRLYSVPSGALIGDESIHGLPMPDMGYEYCTMTELMFSLTSALQKLGDSAYGDWIENLTFNAAQGARFADGSGICYLSAENRVAALASRPDSYSYWHTDGRFKYSPTHEDIAVCCNPNAIRLLPHYISRMWMQLQDRPGLAAVLYGPSTLATEINGVAVAIEQATNYPFDDEVTFTIQPEQDVEFALYLRRPAWSTATTTNVVGAAVEDQDGFMVVNKRWSARDAATVSFQANIEPVQYPNGEYGVRRGVLQYAMPIPHETKPIKPYAVQGFNDYDIFPQDVEQAYQFTLLDESKPDLGLSFSVNENVDLAHPWDTAPYKLKTDSIELVPMGCTVLRRSTFPMKRVD